MVNVLLSKITQNVIALEQSLFGEAAYRISGFVLKSEYIVFIFSPGGRLVVLLDHPKGCDKN